MSATVCHHDPATLPMRQPHVHRNYLPSLKLPARTSASRSSYPSIYLPLDQLVIDRSIIYRSIDPSKFLAGKDAPRGLKNCVFLRFFTFQKERTKTRVFELDFFVPDHTGTVIRHYKYLSSTPHVLEYLLLNLCRAIESVSPINMVPVPVRVPLYSI